MSRIIPLVLNDTTLPDGEKATLLRAFEWEAPGTPDIEFYAAALPSRTSRLKTELVLQMEVTKFGFAFIVRSPFASLGAFAGSPMAAPKISFGPVGPVGAPEDGFTIRWLDAAYDRISWPNTGSIGTPTPGFGETFNGKAIPHWRFVFLAEDQAEEDDRQFFLTIDFSHSIT